MREKYMEKGMNKRGQLAIFIIIAIVIAGVILLIYFYPKISPVIAPSEISPMRYLQDCVESDVKTSITLLANQGGYQNPEGFIDYNGTKIKYLCYVSDYYQTCLIQQPMIITHFGNELSRLLTTKAEKCAEGMKAEFANRGYQVSMGKIAVNVSIEDGRVHLLFNTPMNLTKQTTRVYKQFDVYIISEIYGLLSISTSIVDFEANYGDSETVMYMQYYPDLKIEKLRLEDGVKLYRVSNVVTNETFQFATRSLVYPPGYVSNV